MKIENTIVWLIGFPGTGKYTIAQNIVKQAGFRLLDNHLINNPVFSVLQMDETKNLPSQVWDNTCRIWRVVFDSILELSPSEFSFVLTNHLSASDPGDVAWYEEVKAFAEKRGSSFVPVRLHISDIEEHRRRLTAEGRAERFKITNPHAPEKYAKGGLLDIPHPNAFTLDVTQLTPETAASAVLKHVIEIK